jgi:NADH dehydrogenase
MAAKLPVLPVIRGAARFQPVWAADVAEAIAQAALHPETHAGRTYELGGPRALSMAELNAWVASAVGAKPSLFAVPDGLASLLASLPGAPITKDQLAMLKTDNVVAPGAAGFEAFDIEPSPLEVVAPSWLVRYRRAGRFSLNVPA